MKATKEFDWVMGVILIIVIISAISQNTSNKDLQTCRDALQLCKNDAQLKDAEIKNLTETTEHLTADLSDCRTSSSSLSDNLSSCQTELNKNSARIAVQSIEVFIINTLGWGTALVVLFSPKIDLFKIVLKSDKKKWEEIVVLSAILIIMGVMIKVLLNVLIGYPLFG